MLDMITTMTIIMFDTASLINTAIIRIMITGLFGEEPAALRHAVAIPKKDSPAYAGISTAAAACIAASYKFSFRTTEGGGCDALHRSWLYQGFNLGGGPLF